MIPRRNQRPRPIRLRQPPPLMKMPIVLHDTNLHPPRLGLLHRVRNSHIRLRDSTFRRIPIVLFPAAPATDHYPSFPHCGIPGCICQYGRLDLAPDVPETRV